MDTNNPVTASNTLSKVNPPKRLIALLVFLVLISVTGLIMKQGVLFCILTLFMVLAIIGKQKAGLIMLRVYTSLQLAIVSMLPLVLYDPENLASSFAIGSFNAQVPDWIIFSILILLAIVQVWIAFTRKVGQYFNREVNLNIMR
ncbi:hypothetical protein [Shewanella sp. GutDb-MelDb]|uniref:hypothetical protein n=1 Tax=Shewanella sp. GutDb-MelDb TaxID=2058316 RepID=UPI000C7DBF27|nr:hypothetical protein [Shewanella sp. GutDb-MelDb]PKG56658.1 hypothetical protein CXF82_13665 [Shewanella sp. GutDb-MelDb]